MSLVDFPLQPPELDLSSRHVTRWRALQPGDLRKAIPDDVAPGPTDDQVKAFTDEMNIATTRGYEDVVFRHAALVSDMGRARRVRLVAWVVQMCWPESDKVLKVLSEAGGDASGEGGAADGGRAKVAPYFRADIEALGGVVLGRIARAVADKGAVRAVEQGIRDFDEAFGPQTSGAM